MKTKTTQDQIETTNGPTDEAMWQAVLRRDVLSDGTFFYAVKSTGIYCRPSCASRRPASREGVEFFADPDAAEDGGYRSCQRCMPAQPENWQKDLMRVQRACRALEQSIAPGKSGLSLEELAAEVDGVSPFHLQKTFKRVLGVSPKQYADAVQLRRFKAMLRSGDNVGVAARDAGLKSPGTLYGRPSAALGISPAKYRAGGAGESIEFAVVPCPLGLMLVAATGKGVCFVALSSRQDKLETALRREFPHAEIRENHESMGPFILAALSSLGADSEASAAAQRLPLDIRGTAFQWRVWLALRAIPVGSVRSYADLAAELGGRNLARAVGTACGSNPVSLAIPCHRVTRSGGTISGYRWGPERKRALLDHEQVIADKKAT